MKPTIKIAFDRGTLQVSGDRPALESAVWDARSSSRRLPAFRFGELVAAARREDSAIDGDLTRAWSLRAGDTSALDLRPYQKDALVAWHAHARRGVIALPTGAGKTRVAVAAILETGWPTAVLCPTKVLASAWLSELSKWIRQPIGLIGDGERRIERVTVLTFESAFRHMDGLGDRFGLLVVDEVHHFGSGARIEALESSAAVARLGLTATGPEPDSEAAHRLEELVGPVVYEMAYQDLVGKHLAPLRLTRIPVSLEADERELYAAKTRIFNEMWRTLKRSSPGADQAALARALARTPQGLRALRDHALAMGLASFPRAKRALVRSLLENHRDDRSIVFTAYADNAYEVAVDSLIPVIAAETSARERQDILQRFRDGRVRAVASARVLNEGVDVPEARIAIIVAGVLGAREHVQRIGRVLRPGQGKEAVVYELVTRETSDERRAARRARHASYASP